MTTKDTEARTRVHLPRFAPEERTKDMPVGLHIEWGIVKAAVAFLLAFAAIMLYYSLRGR